jgi:hypothetical protein
VTSSATLRSWLDPTLMTQVAICNPGCCFGGDTGVFQAYLLAQLGAGSKQNMMVAQDAMGQAVGAVGNMERGIMRKPWLAVRTEL